MSGVSPEKPPILADTGHQPPRTPNAKILAQHRHHETPPQTPSDTKGVSWCP
ncbi:hypothetical protein [Nostoc sp.]